MKFRPMTVLPWCLVAVLMCVAMAPKPQNSLTLISPDGNSTVELMAKNGKCLVEMRNKPSGGESSGMTFSLDSTGFGGFWITRGDETKKPMVAIFNDPRNDRACVGVYGSKQAPAMAACLYAGEGNSGQLQVIGSNDKVHQFSGDDLAD